MSTAWGGTPATPMFPLGTVLFPHMHQSLRVFEPRYRQLMRDCLAGDGRFGVVLIERGHEVGGGDTRFATGTMATIAQHVEMPDGNWLVEVAGTHRIRVIRWLPDDPYPRAMIEDAWESEPTDRAGELRDAMVTRLRRVLARRAELGEAAAPATLDLAGDPSMAVWQAATAAELGSFDAQLLLEQPGPDERLQALCALLDDLLVTLDAQIAGG